MPDDGEKGYFVECDLSVPKELHDKFNNYPLAPEKFRIDYKALSDKQVEIKRHYPTLSNTSAVKLVPNLLPKKKYCLHSANLKFYLQQGLVLGKVHRVIGYHQSKWLAPYIKLNQDLRALASDEFAKDLFKLINNAIFGKTGENQKKRTDTKIVRSQ